MLKIGIFSLAALAAFAGPLVMSPAKACDDLRQGPVGRVVQVSDGDTVVLDSGLMVRLIGMQAPKLPLGRAGFKTWPKAQEAKAELEALVLGQMVQLRYGDEQMDRYERALAHVFTVPSATEPEIWAQHDMVTKGWARVYSFPDNRKCLDELLAAEARARANRLGIWADPYYTIQRADKPDQVLERAGQYELIEGRVLRADRVGSRAYLNFGRYWKEDFTAVIDSRALALFETEGQDPLALEGALVRIRGWVDEKDGPRIEVTHPEQIEVLATQ